MIDITIKLISEESVKMFDKLAINPLRILLPSRGFKADRLVSKDN